VYVLDVIWREIKGY